MPPKPPRKPSRQINLIFSQNSPWINPENPIGKPHLPQPLFSTKNNPPSTTMQQRRRNRSGQRFRSRLNRWKCLEQSNLVWFYSSFTILIWNCMIDFDFFLIIIFLSVIILCQITREYGSALIKFGSSLSINVVPNQF